MSILLLFLGGLAGVIWYAIGGLPFTDPSSHGAVSVPGSTQLSLPAATVWIYFEESGLGADDKAQVPPGLAVTVRSAGGQTLAIEPLSQQLFSVTVGATGRVPFGRADVKAAGSYTVSTTVAGGTALFSKEPRVTFGEPPWNPFGAPSTGALIVFLPFLVVALLLRLPLRRQMVPAPLPRR
jgi:hypothetical protein